MSWGCTEGEGKWKKNGGNGEKKCDKELEKGRHEDKSRSRKMGERAREREMRRKKKKSVRRNWEKG